MKIERNDVYDFFFHPLKKGHSTFFKVGSTIAVALLSLATAGMFLIAFSVVNLCDRNVVHQKVAKHKLTALMKNLQLPSESQNKIKNLKEQHSKQLKLFEQWAESGDWKRFKPEYSHYDWWAFPITRPSSGYGNTYAVNEKEIEALKADTDFMKGYRRGVELVVKSWGWDINRDAQIPESERNSDQTWTGYEVRLGKMGDSLYLFGEKELFEKVKRFYQSVCVPSKYPLSDWVRMIFSRN